MVMMLWATGPLWALTKEESLLTWTGLLASAIIVCAMFIARMERWRKRQMEIEDDNPRHFGSFREMYDNGAITKTEYDRVMRRIADKAEKARPDPVAPEAAPPTPPAGPLDSPEPPVPPT
jgi:hypothetical protein